MDPVPSHFQPSETAVLDLIRSHPLAWVVTSDLRAILLPIRPIQGSGECLSAFRGHMPRRISSWFADGSTALLLFTGPSAYISPSWFTNRKQAPTWSSASAAFRCSIRLIDEPEELRASLTDLAETLEAERPKAWNLAEVGERYDGLARRILAFRADILDQRAAFRLGQDEDEQTFADTLAGLRTEGRESFAELMTKFRP